MPQHAAELLMKTLRQKSKEKPVGSQSRNLLIRKLAVKSNQTPLLPQEGPSS